MCMYAEGSGPSLSEEPRQLVPRIFYPKIRGGCLRFLGSRSRAEGKHAAEVRSLIIIFLASITHVINR